MSNPLDTARDVIDIEIEGLQALSAALDSQLGQSIKLAVNAIVKTQSYVIVVGVGKSGHIGRKIAASFASTGTPAFFLHPTEALHGDMGMLANDCTLLALSNSGESQELRAVLAYAQSILIPIIAITANTGSSLARAANITLELPKAREACPNGLAPTTSTTNTLTLGDALTVAVMQERGFTCEDFGRRHPGGKIGLQLQSVAQWIDANKTRLPSVTHNQAMSEVILAISGGGKGCTAVLGDNGQMVGMITDGDLRRAMDENFMNYLAQDIMATSPITLQTTMKIKDVIALFTDKRISNAFVVENGMPIALIDMKTLLESGYV